MSRIVVAKRSDLHLAIIKNLWNTVNILLIFEVNINGCKNVIFLREEK